MTPISSPPPPHYDDLLLYEGPPSYDAERLPDYSAQEPPSALMADVLTLCIASMQRSAPHESVAAPPVRRWQPESATMRALRLPDALAQQPRPAFHPLFDPIAGEALAAASLQSVATLFAHSCGQTFSLLQPTLPFSQSLRGVVTREMLGRWRQLGAGAQLDSAAYARAAAQLTGNMDAPGGLSALDAEVSATQARIAWALEEVAPMLPSEEVLGFECHVLASRRMILENVMGRPPQHVIDIFRRPEGRDPAQGQALHAFFDAALEQARIPSESGDPDEAAHTITRGLTGLRCWVWLEQLR